MQRQHLLFRLNNPASQNYLPALKEQLSIALTTTLGSALEHTCELHEARPGELLMSVGRYPLHPQRVQQLVPVAQRYGFELESVMVDSFSGEIQTAES